MEKTAERFITMSILVVVISLLFDSSAAAAERQQQEEPCLGILPSTTCTCSDQVINCSSGVSLESLQQIPTHFPRLVSLHLAGNRFEYLMNDTFNLRGANWNLKQLDLSNTGVVDITQQAFVNLPELEELKLTNNTISFRIRPYVPGRRVWKTGSFLSPLSANLRTLNLAGAFNRDETREPEHFEENLATVNLFNAIDRFQAMEYLDLSNNDLLHLPANIFQGMPTLQYLYLSKNLLVAFEMETIDAARLIALDLRSNRIQRVNESFIRMVESRKPLTEVQLSDNPLICDCESLPFVEWAYKSPKISDRDRMTCSVSINGQQWANRSLSFALSQLRGCADYPNDDDTQQPSGAVVFLLCALAAVALIGLVSGVIYVNRRLLCRKGINLRNWLTMNTTGGGYEMLETETRIRPEAVPL